MSQGSDRSGRERVARALCFAIPVAVLVAAYTWLALDHDTTRLWNVVVHESGRYTLAGTVFYFGHFLREVPTALGYALFLLAISGGIGPPPGDPGASGHRAGWLALALAAALVAWALLEAAADHGWGSALLDLAQYRTRDDLDGYGTHWRYHVLSSLWFGAAAGLAPLAARRLGISRLRADPFWRRVAWGYFVVLTLVFGVSADVFLDVRYAGHQAREILTHASVTLLLGLGVLLSFSSPGGPGASARSARRSLSAWIFLAIALLVPVHLASVSLAGDVMAEGQSDLGLGAMVGAHYFEHALDYLLVLLVLGGVLALRRRPTTSPLHRIDPVRDTLLTEERPARPEEESDLPALDHAVSVVIPAYNEAGHVARQIRAVREVLHETGWDFEILVVDDGSTDATGREALSEGVRVLRNRRNRGYGAALVRGIEASTHEWVLIIDADGTYPAASIPDLLALADTHEMVVGARITARREIPLARRPAKWFLTRLASYLARQDVPDLNSGLRLIRRELVKTYRYLLPSGFSFTTTITLAATSNEHDIAYVPVDYHARVGQSKIRPGHAFDFLLLVLRIIVFFNPLRVFIPIGALMAAVGLAKFIYDLTLQNISESALLGLLGALVVWAVGLLADQNARLARRQ